MPNAVKQMPIRTGWRCFTGISPSGYGLFFTRAVIPGTRALTVT